MTDAPDSMVERVARELCLRTGIDPDESNIPIGTLEPNWKSAVPLARAAIAAMRTLSDNYATLFNSKIGYAACLDDIKAAWAETIDEALK